MRPPLARRAAAAALALGTLAACARDPQVTVPAPPAAAPFMARYVALGNSITAGFQSDGINDSTQIRAYPVLLAEAAGVPFRVPLLRRPGCPAPIVNFVDGQRVGPAGAASPTGCYGRLETSATNLLNNVAVPGANSFDPLGNQGPVPSTNALTTLILGGRSQVQRALDLDPTFATVWIGNNDVLGFALAGTQQGVTDSATFINNYAQTVNQLRATNAGLRGVLIGVVDVTNTPLLVRLSVFNSAGGGTGAAAFQPAALQGALALFGVGTTRPLTFQLTFDASCTGSQASISIPALRAVAAALPAAAPGFRFVCTPGAAVPAQILDDNERAFFVRRVAGWNAYIRAKADSVNFGFYDVNPTFVALRSAGQIPPFPNLAAPTRPFGPLVSNDGVHPGSIAHAVVARALVGVINTKYQATLDSNRIAIPTAP